MSAAGRRFVLREGRYVTVATREADPLFRDELAELRAQWLVTARRRQELAADVDPHLRMALDSQLAHLERRGRELAADPFTVRRGRAVATQAGRAGL